MLIGVVCPSQDRRKPIRPPHHPHARMERRYNPDYPLPQSFRRANNWRHRTPSRVRGPLASGVTLFRRCSSHKFAIYERNRAMKRAIGRHPNGVGRPRWAHPPSVYRFGCFGGRLASSIRCLTRHHSLFGHWKRVNCSWRWRFPSTGPLLCGLVCLICSGQSRCGPC